MTDLSTRAEAAAPEEARGLLEELDDWLAKQCAAIGVQFNTAFFDGADIHSPEMRALWGQSHAYHRVRSYVHGMRAARSVGK